MTKKQKPTLPLKEMHAARKSGVPWSEVRRRLEVVHIKGDPTEGFTGSLPFHLDRCPTCTVCEEPIDIIDGCACTGFPVGAVT